ncbi:MAG: anthranilate phosphoribosyltransferase, partial [Alphaproteobacteria bacterium]
VVPLAEVCEQLGSEHVWVVHGSDGLDELTTTGPTFVAELRDGRISSYEVVPADAGLPQAAPADLLGDDAQANAAAIRDVLEGKASPLRDIAVLNAAAALIVGGKAEGLKQGAELAAEAIDSGAARRALEKLVEISQG